MGRARDAWVIGAHELLDASRASSGSARALGAKRARRPRWRPGSGCRRHDRAPGDTHARRRAYSWNSRPRGASVAQPAVPATGLQATARLGRAIVAVDQSAASAAAWTNSTARATMLRKTLVAELVSAGPWRPAPLPPGDADGRRRGSIRAVGPTRYASAVQGLRLERIGALDLFLAEGRPQSGPGMSIPSLETMRPSFIGYSAGWRRPTRGRLASKAGVAKAATSRPSPALARPLGRAPLRRPRELLQPRRAVQPPTRTLTGWIGRPPSDRRRSVADPLQRAGRARPSPGRARPARCALAKPEEIRRVEQIHMEGMALDPLAAVEQPAQRPDGRDRPRRRTGASKAWTAVI